MFSKRKSRELAFRTESNAVASNTALWGARKGGEFQGAILWLKLLRRPTAPMPRDAHDAVLGADQFFRGASYQVANHANVELSRSRRTLSTDDAQGHRISQGNRNQKGWRLSAPVKS